MRILHILGIFIFVLCESCKPFAEDKVSNVAGYSERLEGKAVAKKDYPSALWFINSSFSSCSGSLLKLENPVIPGKSNVILTAAHCLHGDEWSKLKIAPGTRLHISSDSYRDDVKHKLDKLLAATVKGVMIHPLYILRSKSIHTTSYAEQAVDVGIIILEEHIGNGRSLIPGEIIKEDITVGSMLRVGGYGNSLKKEGDASTGNDYRDDPNIDKLLMFERAKVESCNESLCRFTFNENHDGKSNFAAILDGDSGAPVYLDHPKYKKGSAFFGIVGVIATSEFFARVDPGTQSYRKVNPWISQALNVHNQNDFLINARMSCGMINVASKKYTFETIFGYGPTTNSFYPVSFFLMTEDGGVKRKFVPIPQSFFNIADKFIDYINSETGLIFRVFTIRESNGTGLSGIRVGMYRYNQLNNPLGVTTCTVQPTK